jgi:hypothetical protein
MPRTIARYAILLAMVVVGLLLCLDVLYFIRGSLEEFPTDEQMDKVRTVTAVIAVVLAVAEIGLWALFRHASATPSRRGVGEA